MWLVENDLDYAVVREDSAHPMLNDLADYGNERRIDWVLQSIVHQEMNETVSEEDKELLNVTNSEGKPKIITLDFHPNMGLEQVRNIQAKIMLQNMDLEVDPCEDFYQYVCKSLST